MITIKKNNNNNNDKKNVKIPVKKYLTFFYILLDYILVGTLVPLQPFPLSRTQLNTVLRLVTKVSSSKSFKTEGRLDVILEHGKLDRESQKDFSSELSLSELQALSSRGKSVHGVCRSL